jgi:biopolymer transport protein ExbD
MNFGKKRARRGSVDAAIDITALIDAAFILIIFLLISTTFKKKDHAFSIALPSASHQEVVVEVERTSVYVTREGELFFLQIGENGDAPNDDQARREGQKVSKADLKAKLEGLVAGDPTLNISILAQKDTDYQKVVEVLSTIREAGVQGVQLPYEYNEGATAPPPAP